MPIFRRESGELQLQCTARNRRMQLASHAHTRSHPRKAMGMKDPDLTYSRFLRGGKKLIEHGELTHW